VRRGWSDADVARLAGENLLRAFAEAEAVAARLATRPASGATIAALDHAPAARADRFQRSRIPAGGHRHQHLLDDSAIERVTVGHCLECRQRHLARAAPAGVDFPGATGSERRVNEK